MQIAELEQLMAMHPEVDVLCREIHKETGRNGGKHFLLSGLHASARAMILSAIQAKMAQEGRTMVVVLDNADDAQYIYNDLQVVSNGIPVFYFPTAHRRRQGAVDEALAIQRTEVLAALAQGTTPNRQNAPIIVTYPEALAESVPQKTSLQQQTISLTTGQELPITQLTQQLVALGFQRVDFVYEPGQYAVRGGIVDVYSYSHDNPYRIDYFGDELDTIREFDIETQLSKDKVQTIDIVASAAQDEQQGLLTDYLDAQTLWVSNDWSVAAYKWQSVIPAEGQERPLPLKEMLTSKTTIELAQKSTFTTRDTLAFDTLPQPAFNKNFDLLIDDLRTRMGEGYTLYICADQVKQTDRLQAIFDDKESGIRFVPIDHTLHEGFVDKAAKICCYTDHQIFERYHRVTLRSENARRGKAILTLKEINQLQVGDYVVHVDHGIGQFAGLVTTNFNGRPQETIKLVYRGGDTLFVSIHNLHRIAKYKGREGTEPTISRLGSGAWERMKERTKDKVKDIARDLIKLYATRKQQQGFAYSPDGYMQHELEASFLYEDTPDQAKATLDIKHDMESPMPMDRLVCGDVGFGKTEVAIRAAFKAATDGKQVAVLVPTTVLAFQHFNTFTERLKDFPVRVDYLTRARKPKEVKQLLADLADGKIDILIGTHKLIGKTVKFHDLGLLIVDEEQKFGVSVKEKLKQLKTNVDTLTMSATPIPRTLQFSLMGARDLSAITTPPANRYPILTSVKPLDDDIVKEAISFELSRNGQVFFVNNRIDQLPTLENMIHRLVPDARVVVGHGQMSPEELEKRIIDFTNHDYDVLLATTIIESGIDMPNVNTIIINNAQNYGLSDLHQLRGRVGRSNRKAFCYLTIPPERPLTPVAMRRLNAIESFSDLGSGIQIAMQDLDIRGAGNLLGAEQSGFIADLGYETYQKILKEAVLELKTQEFADTFEQQESEESKISGSEVEYVNDCTIDTDLELFFPSTYVPQESERISLYRELDNMESDKEVSEFEDRMRDRFGPIPKIAAELIRIVPMRRIARTLGVEKVALKQGNLYLYFVGKENAAYYNSNAFGRCLAYLQSEPRRCKLRDVNDRCSFLITGVKSVSEALALLQHIAAMPPA